MDKNNPVYKVLIDEFGSLSHARKKLGFKSRQSIYDLIEAGGASSVRAKNIITESGYDPVTFKPVEHVKKEIN